MNERIAWVGIGRMGEVMVERLLAAGRTVGVWNRTPEKCDAVVAHGATRLAEISDAAGYDVIISTIIDDHALDDLAGRLFSGEVAAKVWIDSSTVSPAAAGRAAVAAARHGVGYVSAPISGNPITVQAGNAIVAISGDDEAALELAESVLTDIGRAVHRVGTGTAANVVKLGVNALLAVTAQSLVEVVVLAEQAGVSRRAFLEFVNDSAIGSTFTRSKLGNLTTLDFTPTFTPQGQRKDVRLALELAQQTETPMPVLSATEVAFSRLIGSGLGEGKDYISLVLQAARDAGLELRPEPPR